MTLSLCNLSDRSMSAGLGFHSWFPRRCDTLYRAFHAGEWQTSPDNLPANMVGSDQPCDWWQGRPVGTRIVDTTYQERAGEIVIEWPDSGLVLSMTPSEYLPFTVVYVPEDADYFCVEPVSHLTDAINRGGMTMLAPGGTIEASLVMVARHAGT